MSETNVKAEFPIRRGMPIWAQVIIWMVLLALLAISALGLSRLQQGAVKTGEVIPNFALTLFDGYQLNDQKSVSLNELKGQVVVLNFWASWCIPCEDEAAPLEAAWKFYQPTGKVVFLGVDHLDSETPARAFLTRYAVSYPNGPDLQGSIAKLFRTSGVPETYIVDQNGKLVASQIGPFTSEAQIRALIDPLLK